MARWRRRDTASILTVAAWNVAQNRVPRSRYGWLNAFGTILVVTVGRRGGLSWEALGLGPGSLRRGIAAARPFVIAATAASGIAAGTPAGRTLVRDERVERLGAVEFAKETLFRIPVGTAVFEETLFRGLLWGEWSQSCDTATATRRSSALFGLWHALPTLEAVAVYRAGLLRRTQLRLLTALTAGVVGTAVAGLGFSELRKRSRSVLAPVIVHGAINVAAYVSAWAAAPPNGPPVRRAPPGGEAGEAEGLD